MQTYRLEFFTRGRKSDFMALNHRANDEAAAAQWAVREHKALRDESFKVFQVHTDDAQVLQELETNLGGLFSSTFAQWRRGRLVELDLGGPLCLFGKSRDAQIEPLHRLTFLEGLSLRGDLGITDQGLRILRPLSKLKSLILDEMQIGDDCLPNLANLTRLETLYL